jgi:hypothetical protein
MFLRKITLLGDDAMVKDLTLHVEVKSSSLHICNLGYLGYLDDLIR